MTNKALLLIMRAIQGKLEVIRILDIIRCRDAEALHFLFNSKKFTYDDEACGWRYNGNIG